VWVTNRQSSAAVRTCRVVVGGRAAELGHHDMADVGGQVAAGRRGARVREKNRQSGGAKCNQVVSVYVCEITPLSRQP
jgi:hypothetical protein